MDIKSLIGHFKPKSKTAPSLSVVVQPSALHLSLPEHAEQVVELACDSQNWQEILLNALKQHKVSQGAVNVVLHSGLYQTYQIEKPKVPEEELSAALPFLIKDLISEKVTDVLVDSTPMPTSSKLQVYVTQKKMVLGLYQSLKSLGLTLNAVAVEDELWAHSAGELTQFLLLQRAKQGQFKISAFVDGHSVFQRTIRGITPPLTGVASSLLQLDSIALELQRSVDYLSSQMRSLSLHQMKVCCDEEDQQEIADALSERLSVKVAPLNDESVESAHVLLRAAQQTVTTVNLFPDSLKPKKQRFTLTNVAIVWAALLVVCVLLYGYEAMQQGQLGKELAQWKQQESSLDAEAKALTEKLAKHKPDAAKVAAVERLKQEIAATRDSLHAVRQFDQSAQVGYSGVMRSLSELARDDISLDSIAISSSSLDLKGLAREAAAIPSWVSEFKSELNLVGRSFEQLSIGRNEQDIITFELKTKGESK